MMDELTTKIILEAFKKAKEDSILKSKNGICTYISNWLEREVNIIIHPRTFTRIYDKHITNNIKGDSKDHTKATINALCVFIGWKDFESYKHSLTKKDLPLYRADIQLGISVLSSSKETVEHIKYMIESLIDTMNSKTDTTVAYKGSTNDPEKHFTNSNSDFVYSWKVYSDTIITHTAMAHRIIEKINTSQVGKIEKKNKIILLDKRTGSTIVIDTLTP